MKDSISPSVSNISEPTKISCFGPPALIEGEDAQAYDELLVRISTAVKPSDFIEEILTRDILDLTWEILRLRRMNAQLIKSQTPNLLMTIHWLSRLDILIASVEARRNAAFREIDRHREVFAQRLREKIIDVENQEMKTIEAKIIT